MKHFAPFAFAFALLVSWSLTYRSANGAITVPALPAGTVIAFAGATCPSSFFKADGTVKSRTTYSTLFAAIGTSHGSGDGSTTFNIPDYRGRFLRGVDGGAGQDPDRLTRTSSFSGGNTGDAVGTLQTYAIQSHSHTSTTLRNFGGFSSSAAGSVLASNVLRNDTSGFNDTTSSTGGNETRPINVTVNFCIKY